jgi:hypothetical protein
MVIRTKAGEIKHFKIIIKEALKINTAIKIKVMEIKLMLMGIINKRIRKNMINKTKQIHLIFIKFIIKILMDGNRIKQINLLKTHQQIKLNPII